MSKREQWIFERTPEMGGATGEAFTNLLLGTGMDPAAVLAREAIQNSADAQAKEQKVRVDFRRVSLVGKDKSDFVSTLQLKTGVFRRRDKLKLPRETCLDGLDDEQKPLQLLYVEDFGTCGLTGKPTSPRSNFFRLLLSLGDGSKARESSGSGGSYGYGKSVYSSNSRVHTIVAYSVIDPALSDTKQKDHARLMACAYFNAHEYRGADFSGRAWFGKQRGAEIADPLVDGEAQDLARRLGFAPRGLSERGTSLLIVDCVVDCDTLRTSIEDWWWPRLLDEGVGLDVRLSDKGERLEPPRPRRRVDLRPFIECYDLAVGRSAPTSTSQKASALNKYEGIQLGEYAFVVTDDSPDDDKLTERMNCIALIRKPRMVIEYMPVGGSLPLPCVGTFVASDEVDDWLKRSEPAAHDKWDAKSARLDELPPQARAVVAAITQRLKSGLRRFAAEAAPKQPKQELRLRSLEKLLGNMFRPPTSAPGGEGGTPSDPISISFVERPKIMPQDSSITAAGSFRVSLADDAEKEKVRVAVNVTCLVQEDEGVSREDPVPVSVESHDLNGKAERTPRGIAFELTRASSPVFSFRSQPYPPDWTTHIQVHVEEV